jgi:hypothetical protein
MTSDEHCLSLAGSQSNGSRSSLAYGLLYADFIGWLSEEDRSKSSQITIINRIDHGNGAVEAPPLLQAGWSQMYFFLFSFVCVECTKIQVGT